MMLQGTQFHHKLNRESNRLNSDQRRFRVDSTANDLSTERFNNESVVGTLNLTLLPKRRTSDTEFT